MLKRIKIVREMDLIVNKNKLLKSKYIICNRCKGNMFQLFYKTNYSILDNNEVYCVECGNRIDIDEFSNKEWEKLQLFIYRRVKDDKT